MFKVFMNFTASILYKYATKEQGLNKGSGEMVEYL